MAINIDHQKDIISANSGILTVDQTGAIVLPKGNWSWFYWYSFAV